MHRQPKINWDIQLTFLTTLAILGGNLLSGILAARLLGVGGRGILAESQLIPSLLSALVIFGLQDAVGYFVASRRLKPGDIFMVAVVAALAASVVALLAGNLVIVPLLYGRGVADGSAGAAGDRRRAWGDFWHDLYRVFSRQFALAAVEFFATLAWDSPIRSGLWLRSESRVRGVRFRPRNLLWSIVWRSFRRPYSQCCCRGGLPCQGRGRSRGRGRGRGRSRGRIRGRGRGCGCGSAVRPWPKCCAMASPVTSGVSSPWSLAESIRL